MEHAPLGDWSDEMGDATRAQIWGRVMRERCGADAERAWLARQLPIGEDSFLAAAVDSLRALVGGTFPQAVETRGRPA